MLHRNGEPTFAQVLVTTRNPTLDNFSEGSEHGGNYITNRVRKVKVKYGLLNSGIEELKVRFGTKEQIHPIAELAHTRYDCDNYRRRNTEMMSGYDITRDTRENCLRMRCCCPLVSLRMTLQVATRIRLH